VLCAWLPLRFGGLVVLALVARVTGVHRVLRGLDVVVEVRRGSRVARVVLGGHDRTVRQQERCGNGIGIPLAAPW